MEINKHRLNALTAPGWNPAPPRKLLGWGKNVTMALIIHSSS